MRPFQHDTRPLAEQPSAPLRVQPPRAPSPQQREHLGSSPSLSRSPKKETAPDRDEPRRFPRVLEDGTPRLYPLTRNVWVFPQANSKRAWIGFLWFGNSVQLRAEDPTHGSGCKGLWYPVKPRGYVCVDEKRATLDADHPSLAGITRHSPNLQSPWPHQYGESIDLKRYRALPSEKTQKARERYYSSHRSEVARARAHESVSYLAGVDLSLPDNTSLALPEIPRTLRTGRNRLSRRSTVAWSDQVNHLGRAFLLSSDLQWVPKDRVVPYPRVHFEGVHLTEQEQLPLAFFRGKPRPKFTRSPDGSFSETGEHFPRLSHVGLTGVRFEVGSDTFLATHALGIYVRQSDAVLPKLRETTPWGTPLGSLPDSKAPSRGRQTWIEASILGGWLIAYEGHTPVFATLMSPGRGGAPQRGRKAVETASTPTGRFKITGKFATATMESSSGLVHSSVPWAQNFSGPHALHSAYWHDQWGELKSGGCINVSPIDGQWLFQHFTEPVIPAGWHGVRWLPKKEPATTLLVRRR